MTDHTLKEAPVIRKFQPITLEEMDGVKLMTRMDTKFVFRRSNLADFLEVLKNQYKILSVNDKLVSSYKTLYFDTPTFQFFLDHHNGKGNRFKVRIRNYVESNLFFLEIKNKYKDKTIKNRINITDFEMVLKNRSANYINEVIGKKINLEAKLWNSFQRITLVNNAAKERLTLDLGLSFSWGEVKKEFDHIVIAELKQEREDRSSLFYRLMKTNGIRSNGMSKYCVGAATLFPTLKSNNFKEKILLIDKLI